MARAARAVVILAALSSVWPGAARAHESAGGEALTRATCGVGQVSFAVELRPDGDGQVSVQVTRPDKPALPVRFAAKAKLALWTPKSEGETACEESVAAVLGDSVVVLLAKDAGPDSPRAAAFLYRLARHEVGATALDLGPLAKATSVVYRPASLCFPSAEAPKASECYRDKCGQARGVGIVKTRSDQAFDEWVCVEATSAGLKATTDPELTWKRLDARLRQVFATRADFEKAFGWDRAARKYRIRRFASAILEDASGCVVPTATGAVSKSETGWLCPAAAAGGK